MYLSVWRDGANLFAGGEVPHGMTATGAAFLAGLLAEVLSRIRTRPGC